MVDLNHIVDNKRLCLGFKSDIETATPYLTASLSPRVVGVPIRVDSSTFNANSEAQVDCLFP